MTTIIVRKTIKPNHASENYLVCEAHKPSGIWYVCIPESYVKDGALICNVESHECFPKRYEEDTIRALEDYLGVHHIMDTEGIDLMSAMCKYFGRV